MSDTVSELPPGKTYTMSLSTQGLAATDLSSTITELVGNKGSAPQVQAGPQEDPAAAINDAFMLGWKITELIGRVQIACELTTGAARVPHGPAPPPQRLESSGLAAAPAQAAQAGNAMSTPLAPAMLERPLDPESARATLGDPQWMTSVWRAIFDKIALIHARRLPNSTTTNTVYQPPSGHWSEVFPYLYRTEQADSIPAPDAGSGAQEPAQSQRAGAASDAPDYASIGLPPLCAGGTNAPILPGFTLYDVTRRALNCLTLLYTSTDDSLIADIVRAYQLGLIQKLAEARKDTPPHKVSEQARVAAMVTLTTATIQLLGAWRGYLHEHFYQGGARPSDTTEMLAHEAGRSLAQLTWSISVAAVTKECAAAPPDEIAEAWQAELAQEMYRDWRDVFATSNVVSAKHNISALSAALDDAYRTRTGTPRPTATTSGPTPIDADLPSQALAAITHSLDFWQRAVEWLDPHKTEVRRPATFRASFWQRGTRYLPLRPAAGRAPASDAGPPPTLTSGLLKNLRIALIAQSNIWLSLFTGEQRLEMFTVDHVMHQLVQEVTCKFRDDMQKSMQLTFGRAVKDAMLKLVPAALIALSAAIFLVVPTVFWLTSAHVTLSSFNPNGIWAILGIGPAIAGLAGLRAWNGPAKSAPTPTVSSVAVSSGAGAAASAEGGLIEHIGSLMGSASATVLTMLHMAYAQIQIDLAALNHAVGVAYPLIECFVMSDKPPAIQNISSDFDFMEKVIWTKGERKEEVESVVRAALGPVGIVIRTQLATAKAGSSGAASGAEKER